MLLMVLGFAVARPGGWPEAVAAVPGAALVVAVGAVTPSQAWQQVTRLLPVVAFLAAVLVLAQLCAGEGVFTAAGDALARAGRRGPARLLTVVFAVAALTTAVLSLDATVVLLTPVVFASAARAGARSRPHVYACTHLANSASLLLPVSNLTNLLAFAAIGITFSRFAALMAVPWLAAIAVEYAVFRWRFRADLASPSPRPAAPPAPAAPAVQPQAGPRPRRDGRAERVGLPGLPAFALVVVGGTLAGFAVTSLAGINPAWAALAGVVVLGSRALARGNATPRGMAAAASPAFLLFVLALGVVVSGVVGNGLATGLRRVLPGGASLPALLATAAAAAVLANVINNLPAVLALLPIVAARGPGAALAVLLGVNIGPNLSYVGSLATLLWRRVLRAHDTEPSLGEFTRLGLLTVPAALLAAVAALWVMLQAIGG